MDAHRIAQIVKGAGPAGQRPALRLRQGTVVTDNLDGTVDVKLAGSDAAVSGIRCLASVCPIPGAAVWLATDGMDLFAIGTIMPTGPVFCTIARTTDGTLSTGTWYDMSFASNSRTDPYGMWSSGAPDRITCIVPGIYQIEGQVTFDTDSNGGRDIRLAVNGGTKAQDMRPPRPGVATAVTVSTIWKLAAGDYIQLGARQSSGANLSILASSSGGVRLTVQWLRGPV